jgi:hypothetical protein
MYLKDVLRQLDLGSSVAEFDEALERYFVETATFRALVEDRGDIIAGDKGTGKTALYRILQRRYRGIPALTDVEVLSGFNATGNPVFQRLSQTEALNEAQYTVVWKAYIVSLVANWLLEIYEPSSDPDLGRLENLLTRAELRTQDFTPQTVFSRLVNTLKRIAKPKSAQVEFALGETGTPSVTPKVEFGPDTEPDTGRDTLESLEHVEEGLRIVNRFLTGSELRVWVVLDRLDEAFQGYPAMEVPVLRALLRTYLDMLEFGQLRLKLFVRRDLFRRIIQGGFVNLTHINARKIEIIWDDEDLFVLLCKRIRESPNFVSAIGMKGQSNEALFDAVFPEQVAAGEKRPDTWKWMVSRVRDGNNVKPPRNLIDLVKKAQEAQIRREEREPHEYHPGEPVFEPEAIRRALMSLSSERVEDTLLAEAGHLAPIVGRFRDNKAEHNVASLGLLLGLQLEDARKMAKALVDIGFLEPIGDSFKVPPLYRAGLGITQGKAF